MNMGWFEKIDTDMVWEVHNDTCKKYLEEIHNADSGEKVLVCDGDGHTVLFFEGELNGETKLLEASVSAGDIVTVPENTWAGRPDNIFNFSEGWNELYLSEGSLPKLSVTIDELMQKI